jgi:bacterioferritin
MAAKQLDTQKVLGVLDEILAHELAGVIRYTHYAFVTVGFTRIPIAAWADANADESLAHARLAGDHIVNLGGHPTTLPGKWKDSGKHDVETMLREARAHEAAAIEAYGRLLALVEGRDIALEEYARSQVAAETGDLRQIERMLRQPGR